MRLVLKKIWDYIKKISRLKFVRQLLYIGIVGFSLLFIAYLIYTNWSQLKEQEWHISVIHLFLAVLLYPLGMFPTIGGWHYLLRAFNSQKPFFLNLRLYAISSLPKHIPGIVWYVTSRSLLYEEHSTRVSIVLGATALETIFLPLSGFIIASLLIPIQAKLPLQLSFIRYLIHLSIVILLLVIVWAPGGSTLIDKLLKRLKISQEGINLNRADLWKGLGWMFIAWIGGGILLWILVRGITDIDYKLLPFMVGAWGVAGAVSLTIGLGIQGLGLREVTLGALLSLKIPPIQAITAAIAFRLILTIGELLWVFLISIFVKDKYKVSDPVSENHREKS